MNSFPNGGWGVLSAAVGAMSAIIVAVVSNRHTIAQLTPVPAPSAPEPVVPPYQPTDYWQQAAAQARYELRIVRDDLHQTREELIRCRAGLDR